MAHVSLLSSIAVTRLIDLALDEDLARGDVTTQAIGLRRDAVGRVICRHDVICAGLPLASRLVDRAQMNVDVSIGLEEGKRGSPSDTLIELRGAAADILMIERTLLNFLMRTCGVASHTARMVALLKGSATRLVDTRKTMPGWRALDKYATSVGGAANHRYDLGSGILIKDNHIAAAGGVADAVKACRANSPHSLKVEVEVDTIEQLKEALEAAADIVLLDNMSPEAVREAVALVDGRAVVEISGGITMETLGEYGRCGADYVSVGAITHSARAVDLSMELVVT